MMSSEAMDQNNRNSVNVPNVADSSEKNDFSSIYGMTVPDSSSAAIGDTGGDQEIFNYLGQFVKIN